MKSGQKLISIKDIQLINTIDNYGYMVPDGSKTRKDAYGVWKEVAKDQKFANDASKKTFTFDEQEVFAVKFVATQSSDGWVTVSEFDMANAPQRTYTVFVQAEEGGRVEGGKDVAVGENVTVKAIANAGYEFAGWYNSLGAKVSDAAEYTFKVTGNTALTAKFEKTDAPVDPVEKVVLTANFEKVEEQKPEKPSKDALSDALAAAGKLEEKDYTADSWKVFADALKDAQEVYLNENATEKEIADALNALKDAQAQLVKADTEEPQDPRPKLYTYTISESTSSAKSAISLIPKFASIPAWFPEL